jgi:protein-disulfide isomerase
MTNIRSLLLVGGSTAIMIGAVAMLGQVWPARSAVTTSAAVLTDQAVRDWLATHPEVVDKMVHESVLRQVGLLGEMNQAEMKRRQDEMAARQAKAGDFIAAHHAALFEDPRDGRAGAAKPVLTIAMFYDPECPICKALQPTLDRLLKEHPEIAIVYKDFPILGAGSFTASRAALASVGQGKYAAFHDALMGSRIAEHQLTEANVVEMAKSVGLDVDRLKADMAAPALQAALGGTHQMAQELAISGTPTLVIGTQLLVGNVPYEQLVALINQSVTAAKAVTAAR